MKKIFAILLVVACLLGAVGCTPAVQKTEVEKIKECYNTMPTKIVVDTVTDFSGTQILSKAELFIGTYMGKYGSVYTHTYQRFETVDQFLTSPIVSVSESKEFFLDLGLRENFVSNKYASFVPGTDFAPTVVQNITPNFTQETVTNVSYVDGVFTATVLKDNGAAVFGEGVVLASDATVVIETIGGSVHKATITYAIPTVIDYVDDPVVTMTVTYNYDVQSIAPLTNE